MRLPIIAGNWKMNTTLSTAITLVRELKEGLEAISGVEKVICPPFISLAVIKEILAGSSIKLGAQNMYFEEKGAYTGEISPLMLKELCQYVIIGHSERRQYFGETDEMINKKLKAVLKFGLNPIFCIGEKLEEREAGRTKEVVTEQILKGLKGIEDPGGLVIAYEPVWAIGTGKPACGEDANEVIGFIRSLLSELFGKELGQAIRIQYGGSVNKENIAEFILQPEIDGALVGGASLNPEEFISIVKQTAEIKASVRGQA